jgi:hypothetical protein
VKNQTEEEFIKEALEFAEKHKKEESWKFFSLIFYSFMINSWMDRYFPIKMEMHSIGF